MVRTIPKELVELEESEDIKILDRPKLLPYMLRGLPLLLAGILWCLVDVSFLFKISNVTSANIMRFFVSFVTIHLIPFYLGILNILRLLLIYKNTSYVLTEQKLLIYHGIIKKEVDVIPLSDIEEVRLKRYFIEKVFKTCSITIEIATEDGEQEIEDSLELISSEKYLKIYKFIRKYMIKKNRHQMLRENVVIEQKSVS